MFVQITRKRKPIQKHCQEDRERYTFKSITSCRFSQQVAGKWSKPAVEKLY